ncbi:flagellar protein [bacterium LRH843]|nr:flagellar protein [bacterium LRH843]
MSVMKELYLETQQLVELVMLPLSNDHDERDRFLLDLEERLAKRENLIQTARQKELSEPEKKLGVEILKLNGRLTGRMDQIRLEIQGNLTELKRKKSTGLKYEHPYDGPTADGVFFDKRGV